MVIKTLVKKAVKRARKKWKYDRKGNKTLDKGKAEVIEGGDKGKPVKKWRIRKPTDNEKPGVKVIRSGRSGAGNVLKVHRYQQKHPNTPIVDTVSNKNKGLLAEIKAGVDKAIKKKKQPREKLKVVDIKTKEKYITPFDKALRKAFEGQPMTQKEIDLITKASKESLDTYLSGKKTTKLKPKPKNGKKK